MPTLGSFPATKRGRMRVLTCRASDTVVAQAAEREAADLDADPTRVVTQLVERVLLVCDGVPHHHRAQLFFLQQKHSVSVAELLAFAFASDGCRVSACGDGGGCGGIALELSFLLHPWALFPVALVAGCELMNCCVRAMSKISSRVLIHLSNRAMLCMSFFFDT